MEPFDVTKEKPLSLSIARELPLFPDPPPSFDTLVRWAQHGYKGVKLEVVRIGGRLCTSEPALLRFIERMNGTPAGKRTPSEASVAQAATRRYLESQGL